MRRNLSRSAYKLGNNSNIISSPSRPTISKEQLLLKNDTAVYSLGLSVSLPDSGASCVVQSTQREKQELFKQNIEFSILRK